MNIKETLEQVLAKDETGPETVKYSDNAVRAFKWIEEHAGSFLWSKTSVGQQFFDFNASDIEDFNLLVTEREIQEEMQALFDSVDFKLPEAV